MERGGLSPGEAAWHKHVGSQADNCTCTQGQAHFVTFGGFLSWASTLPLISGVQKLTKPPKQIDSGSRLWKRIQLWIQRCCASLPRAFCPRPDPQEKLSPSLSLSFPGPLWGGRAAPSPALFLCLGMSPTAPPIRVHKPFSRLGVPGRRWRRRGAFWWQLRKQAPLGQMFAQPWGSWCAEWGRGRRPGHTQLLRTPPRYSGAAARLTWGGLRVALLFPPALGQLLRGKV